MDNRNSEAREEILTKIRSAKKENESLNKDDNPKPDREGNGDKEVNYVSDPEKFISNLKKTNATVSVIDSKNTLIKEVHDYVVKNKVNTTITLANDDDLTSLDWQDVDVTTEYVPNALSVSVTFAAMGIEETGTLVIMSSPTCPTGMNFLPDHHVVVLNSDNIVERVEDVWQCLRNNKQEIPRTINLITGPSRTADIEYKIEMGAHGPKYLHVILIRSS